MLHDASRGRGEWEEIKLRNAEEDITSPDQTKLQSTSHRQNAT